VNEQDFERLQVFQQVTVVPAFEQVCQLLESWSYQTRIIQSESTAEGEYLRMVKGLSRTFGSPFLDNQDVNTFGQHKRLMLALLVVERLDLSDALQDDYQNQFCCGIECLPGTEGKIEAVMAAFCMKRGQKRSFERSEHGFAGKERQTIEMLKEKDLTTCFLELLLGFEQSMPQSQSEAIDITLEVELSALPEETPTQLGIPATALSELGSPDEMNLERIHQQEVGVFLESLSLQKQYAVNTVQGFALSRTLAWVQAVGEHRAYLSEESRQTYDWLVNQGTMFAQSFQPRAADEFIDYLRFYEVVLNQDCSTVLSQEPSESLEQKRLKVVRSAGEVHDPSQITANSLQQMRLFFRRLARQFGQPNEFGTPEYVGSCRINVQGHSTKQMIAQIQGQAQQWLLLFDPLSWAVVQLYENAGCLPAQERHGRRTLVQNYLASLRQTVESPTEAVKVTKTESDDFCFCFRRRVLDGTNWLVAEALVGVDGIYGHTAALEYRLTEEANL
jgi:hypothetical protein